MTDSIPASAAREPPEGEPLTFVLDTLPVDDGDFERTRRLVAEKVAELEAAGVRINGDLGIGLAINESRAAVLDVFGKR